MMNQELYAQIEKELERHHVDEDADEVLFGMSEEIADSTILDQEVVKKERFGRTVIEACGVCESGEEAGVFLKWLKIGETQIVVEDYFL